MANKLFVVTLQIILLALSASSQDFDLEALNEAVFGGSNSSDFEVIQIPNDEGIVSISSISDEEFPEEDKPDFGDDSRGVEDINDAEEEIGEEFEDLSGD